MLDEVDNKLLRVLASREVLRPLSYPYVTKFIDADGIDHWLDTNCKGTYRIMARFNGSHLIHFELEHDFVLYQLTWE